MLTRLGSLCLLVSVICITPSTTSANHTAEAGRPAIWAATPKQILKINAQTGADDLKGIDHPGLVAIAIDAGDHTVWTYGKGQLTAYAFDGSRKQQMTLQPPKAIVDGKITIGKRIDQTQRYLIDVVCAKSIDLVVNQADQSVWLGLCGTVYHYSADGQLLNQFQIKGYRFLKALAVNEAYGTLWVAAGRSAINYTDGGDEQQRITLGRFNQIADLDYNQHNGQVIIADLFGLQYFNNEGERLNQLNQRGLVAVRWDKQQGIWAASSRHLFWIDTVTPIKYAANIDWHVGSIPFNC